jgi:hypothetical protein
MTDYDWATIRTAAIRRLGETPNAPTEHDITETFKDNPQLVVQVIDAVIAEKAAGASMRSAWAIIRHRTSTSPAEPIVATDHRERDLRTRQAEAWTRNAGLYIDVERELISELFDEGGMLHPWRTKPSGDLTDPTAHDHEGDYALNCQACYPNGTPLEQRMITLWENERPRGQQAERDVITRAEGRKAIRALQQEAQRSKPTPPEKTSSAPSGASTQPPAKTPTATTPSTPQPTKTPSATPSVPSRDSVATTTQPSKSPAEPDSDPHWHQRPEPESDPTWHVRPEPEVTA